VKDVLGRGASGSVYSCLDQNINVTFAIKVVERGFEAERRMAEKMKGRIYKYVVTIREVFDNNEFPKHFFIVMEYCNHTSLY
jgi:serine/threonine protein kinase